MQRNPLTVNNLTQFNIEFSDSRDYQYIAARFRSGYQLTAVDRYVFLDFGMV